MSDLVEIGDTIVVTNWIGASKFKITRVTKTLAFSKREADGYEYKFKRRISYDMAHPWRQWNQNKYQVIKGE